MGRWSVGQPMVRCHTQMVGSFIVVEWQNGRNMNLAKRNFWTKREGANKEPESQPAELP